MLKPLNPLKPLKLLNPLKPIKPLEHDKWMMLSRLKVIKMSTNIQEESYFNKEYLGSSLWFGLAIVNALEV